ncbi:MAG: hypothetical protein JNK78_05330 [Planctomycetes bacterium]|nr:hypothetical protein [Planctomycetota bacterium]
MPDAPTSIRRRRLGVRHVALALVWLIAAAPPALWLAHSKDPEAAVRAVQVANLWLTRGAFGAGIVTAILLLLFPPFPAWVRLVLHRSRLAFATDRGPLLRALGELQHFETAQRHLEAGRLALQLGDLDTAAPHLVRARELEPGLAAVHQQIGLLAFRVGDLPTALDGFTRAESFDPGHAFGDALLFGGRCLYLLGDAKNAAAVLREHDRRHGGSARSQFWLAEALVAADDPVGAAAAFASAAAPPKQKLTPEDNWFRARARVRAWRRRNP